MDFPTHLRVKEQQTMGTDIAVKELVCRMTLQAVRAELWTGLPLYRWLGAEDVEAAPAATG